MSELIDIRDNRATIHWKLLTTASAVALTAYLYSAGESKAEDSERPQLWIEFGGQLERMSGGQETFSPAFFDLAPPAVVAPMTDAQRPLLYSNGAEGKISFEPEGSDWVFSAAIRYGRSNASRHKHYQGAIPPTAHGTLFGKYAHFSPHLAVFGDGQSDFQEKHTILDFQAGKDVGLGIFGIRGEGTISAGVRFAQFASGSHMTAHARPTYAFGPPMTSRPKYSNFRNRMHATYTAIVHTQRDARAVGPSLSWEASMPVAGNSSDMTLNIDWGVNAAALFGKQHTKERHQTTGYTYKRTGGPFSSSPYLTARYAHPAVPQDRSRSVVIPNVGGFAGLSLKFPNAKVSLGYRADFFFNAIDGGLDTRKEENRGFYGPYASISFGLGD